MRIYVGCNQDATREVFKSASEPTFASHGDTYAAVIGPFRTMRGARFMADYGKGNPHVQCVDDAEQLAKSAIERPSQAEMDHNGTR